MNGRSLKIIKRKNAASMASDKTQDLSEPKLVATMSREKIERRLHRIMSDTVSSWISEFRETRAEEVLAMRGMFDGESFLSKTA